MIKKKSSKKNIPKVVKNKKKIKILIIFKFNSLVLKKEINSVELDFLTKNLKFWI